jgi:predicted phage tail protein
LEEKWTESAKFELLLKEMRAVRQEISIMNTTVSDLHATIKEQNTRIDSLEARIENMESKMNDDKHSAIGDLEETISQLKLDIQDRDQQMLTNDVEISSLPEQPSENPIHVLLTVAKKMGLNLEESDVVSAERAGPVRGAVEGGAAARPRPLVARLARRSARDALLQAARVRRGVTTEGMALPGTATRFYVNERLTKVNRQLFQKVREAAKGLKWRYVWSREGRIFARREQGDTVHRLRTEADITKVFGMDLVRTGAH